MLDAALVIRYFGSKVQLPAEAVARGFDPGGLLKGDRRSSGQRLARSVLQKEEAEGGCDPMLALLRSAPNERAAGLLRDDLDEQFVRPLARYLEGERAE